MNLSETHQNNKKLFLFEVNFKNKTIEIVEVYANKYSDAVEKVKQIKNFNFIIQDFNSSSLENQKTLKEESIIEKIQKTIDGINYRERIPKEVISDCKKHNIIIVFGASDDLLEFEGAYCDELGANDGFNYEDLEIDSCRNDIYELVKKLKLKSIWCPDEEKSWKIVIDSDYKFRIFNIIEDDEIYCEGLIIQL